VRTCVYKCRVQLFAYRRVLAGVCQEHVVKGSSVPAAHRVHRHANDTSRNGRGFPTVSRLLAYGHEHGHAYDPDPETRDRP